MADILKQNIIIIIFQLLDTTCCTSFYYTILQKINAVALNQGGGGNLRHLSYYVYADYSTCYKGYKF
jgi:hypothetical protein